MGKTDFAEAAALNALLAGSYVGLLTAAPGEATPGTEVSGGSYARQLTGLPSTGNSTSRSNPSDITFPVATGNWGLVTHFAIYNALSGGDMLYYGALGSNRNIQSGDTFKFAAGALVVGED